MKEFMLLIRNEADSKSAFSAEQDIAFLNACKVYIGKLTNLYLKLTSSWKKCIYRFKIVFL